MNTHLHAHQLRAILLVVLVTGCWLVGGSACRAQVGKAQPVPEGAARIDIKTDLADSLLFERVVTLLQADGYSGSFRTEKAKITTDSRPIDAKNWTARLVIVLANGTAQLVTEGSHKTASSPVKNERLTYRATANSATKSGFARLDAFARHLMKSIPGATLTYQVLP